MGAIESLKANNAKNFIVNKYIDQVLEEGAERIFERQEEAAGRSSEDLNDLLSRRSYQVTNKTLSLSHVLGERFKDMKPRYKGQKQTKIHNTQIWSEFNVIASKLAYGFTQTAKQLIAKQYNIEING